ncbi:MAG: hypothetical protein IPL87_01585 [Candidatus Moraniibacteriota bacterium]|nr:MAG: hypothetical protein IPL87_01585 [Candidatus Moranbacteria bacterium]
MGLHDLEKELHRHEGEMREAHPKSEFDPMNTEAVRDDRLSLKTPWNASRENFFLKNRSILQKAAIAVGAFVVFMVIVGSFIRIQRSLFSESRVSVSVTGPQNVNSSDLSRFTLSYENANRAAIHDAQLVVSYPPNFKPEGNDNVFRNDAVSSSVTIGEIPGFGKGTYSFSGKFYGSKNSVAYIRATLRYKPKNLESIQIAEGQKSVNLRTSSLTIDIEAPLSVPPEGEANYLVSYANASDTPLSNIRLKVRYPDGFSFLEAAPLPSEGESVWYIGNIPVGGKGVVRITGRLPGVPEENKVLQAELGTFQGDNSFLSLSMSERRTKIIAPPFGITQTLNGSAPVSINPGDDIRYRVLFKNNSPVRLRDTIVTVELDGDALDYARLNSEGGAYDSARKVIIWKASDVSSLANLSPNETGEVKFSVPVRGDLIPESAASKNFRIRTTAKIDSPDVPNPSGANKIVSTNTANVKVNSRLILESRAVREDNKISNSGPIPPKVGEETTYTIRWLLSNTTNDVTGGEVSANLPTGARWTGKTFPSSESIAYNERTNRIVWNVGTMGAGEGILFPKREVRFQVSVRPEVNQIGSNVPLLGVSTAKARDIFTNEILQTSVTEKSSSVTDDSSVSSNGYKVVP